jgi:hypothetical protein
LVAAYMHITMKIIQAYLLFWQGHRIFLVNLKAVNFDLYIVRNICNCCNLSSFHAFYSLTTASFLTVLHPKEYARLHKERTGEGIRLFL